MSAKASSSITLQVSLYTGHSLSKGIISLLDHPWNDVFIALRPSNSSKLQPNIGHSNVSLLRSVFSLETLLDQLSLSRLPVDLERPTDGGSRLSCLDTTPSIYRNASWRWSNVEQIPKCWRDRIFVRCFSTGDAKKRDITASMGRSSRTTTFVSLPRMNIPPWSTVACFPLLPDTCRCSRVWSASSKREINDWLIFVNVKTKERILKCSKIC